MPSLITAMLGVALGSMIYQNEMEHTFLGLAEILQSSYSGSIELKGFSVLFFVFLALLLIYKADLFPEAALKAQVKGYRSDHKADSA